MEQSNLDYIKKLSGDNAEFKKKLIDIIKYELPLEIVAYEKFIEEQKLVNAAESVHKLKHKINILGMEKSYYIAETFENNLKENSLDLSSEFKKILDTMQNFIKTL